MYAAPARGPAAGPRGPGRPIEGAMTTPPAGQPRARTPVPTDRPWIGVHFLCAGQYVKVFRDVRATRYLARCPRCGRCARFRVGAGGTDQRFFEVSC